MTGGSEIGVEQIIAKVGVKVKDFIPGNTVAMALELQVVFVQDIRALG